MAKPDKKQADKLLQLQAQCDKFNEVNPVGSDVTVKLDGVAEPLATKTRSEAQVLSGHTAVIWLENVTGCYLLDRVAPLERQADRPREV